jgi:3-deoxy-manno-octulosonate cytidylyltransferase (CMP-KDO synthetase)
MIERVYRQVEKSMVAQVIVATDDERIQEVVESFGGRAIMTSPDIGTGTERCRAVVKSLNLREGCVINIQGDEPFIEPGQINRVISLLENPAAGIATLVSPAVSAKEVNDPNRVKAVLDQNGRAMYFSRLPVPYHRQQRTEGTPFNSYLIHLGIYGFQIEVLLELEGLTEGVLEAAESLEQLRWLENGYHIYTDITPVRADSVDTREDLEALQKKFFL